MTQSQFCEIKLIIYEFFIHNWSETEPKEKAILWR